MNKVLLSLSAMCLLAGCASTSTNAPTTTPSSTPTPAMPNATMPTQPATKPQAAIDPLNDPNSPLAKRSVYFDFDKFAIKSDYTDMLQAHGRYLAAHPEKHVRIEGNADERGSREYNLALGQKRSEATLKALETYGATQQQLEATSNGKEKPRAQGHDEAAWTENRRADLMY